MPAGERGQTTVREVACPLSEVARATADELVADLLSSLNECSEGRALVLEWSPDGDRVPADISHALERLARTPGAPGSSRH